VRAAGERLLLTARLPQLEEAVTRLQAESLAFPVLHFFHGADSRRSLAPRIAALRDTVVGQPCATAVDEVPATPRLADHVRPEVPTVPQDRFDAAVDRLADRRCQLLSYVRDDSWSWTHVYEISAGR
jgi:hypothetical protein